ncbi:hypothetical protein F0562_003994 [Nyssa sinensis]|uniref:IST1-like protein n=1 Tax=Nyssa sinensis TaxID=561372 RepID=A0A5J5BWY7_9ASTE|nr:hypothetical protein F0562_003994 [Nyssa sinensis]
MTAASVATSHCKKAVKFAISIFCRGFNSSKCKTMAKMAVARIKLLRNKREVVVKQMRRDIALLLQSGQDATARIRVEHVIREQNIMAANEFIELFCELVVARLPIIAKQRECPADLKEGISSLIFAAPRCSDIPELLAIRDIFEKKYGKDFVSAATDLRPNSGVNRMLIEKLSVRTPAGEVKLKFMKEIAKEYQIEWDTADSETELLKPPEERIVSFSLSLSLVQKSTHVDHLLICTLFDQEGPCIFVSAASMPVKPIPKQPVDPNKPTTRYSASKESDTMYFEDTVSAAEAAAESAKRAIAAAEAAAYLANKESNQNIKNVNGSSIKHESGMYQSRSFERSHYIGDEETVPTNTDAGKVYRRHSYNAPSAQSHIKFDESDCDEEIEMEDPTGGTNLPSNQPAPQVPSIRVHPKLPDYDALAARFDALKYRK